MHDALVTSSHDTTSKVQALGGKSTCCAGEAADPNFAASSEDDRTASAGHGKIAQAPRASCLAHACGAPWPLRWPSASSKRDA
ncbi:hypothetical protein CC85DRAFT_284218 [Cutaneotrichosporon oleaginosum]|uniref:Uncharacterized protein n=1 Tax=Cutaneotrichosporon oleaginosum TaxID=879819 RepID=A0A0J1B7J0_9TREE|nr:uncharacterized protein CC85DRAFT_284218 [Cutaneotrichosporon oleaginosum]KLT43709.1 hypothetical protein CC85DRAFT_284218 [Cutaneotrichosporon oleaginosum]TXT05127.1 hypothetical protein COLE_06447 [Cutaneotrichosporon oleaginosum]